MAITAIQMSTGLRKMQSGMKRNMQVALYNEGRLLLNDVKDHAPVDSGLYRKSWVLSRNRVSIGNSFTGILISNNTPYAYYMEFGAPEGGPPWYYPNPKKKRSGKLIRRNGRVWAGGKNPGHTKTIGGAYSQVFTGQRMNKLTGLIADSIIGGLP